MTDNPQPEALRLALSISLMDTFTNYQQEELGKAAAELRSQHTRIAELESELEAVGAGGVQALSAAPEAIAKLRHLYQNMVNGAVRDTASAKRIAEGLLAPAIEALERATPPAEQQAAPKAAPGEPSDYQIRAITTAYEQGVGKGHQAYISGKETANPYDSTYRCDLAWQYGYREGKEQAQRGVKAAAGGREQAASQPAPAPLREREAFEAWIKKDGGDLGTFGTPPNMHYRNSAVNNAWVAWKARAALAAQGGKDA